MPRVMGRISDLLLTGPVHDEIGRHKRRSKVEDLTPAPSIGVEDCCRQRSSEGTLSICRKRIGNNSFLWLGPFSNR